MQNNLIPTVIGIDIGSYTTKIAAVQRGAVDIITNQANFRETPTVIGFGQGERKFGQIAYAKLKSNHKNSIISPHRYLGLTANNPLTIQQLSHCPSQSRFDSDRLLFKIDLSGKQQNLTSQQILASYITHILSIIKFNNLDNKLICFSIPLYYTQIQKKLFINAISIAGINNYKIITSSVAIGLDYGSFKKSEICQGKIILFTDFGHSKLSVTLIKFNQSEMDIIYQKSWRNLGCRDIDRKILDYIANKFLSQKGIQIKKSKRACYKLLQSIQKQRKILSAITQTQIHIQSLIQDQDITQILTRQSMHQISIDIFNQINEFFITTKQQISKLDIKIDAIELVGGGSRIPKVIQIIQQIFNMTTSRTINSSQTIAIGATLSGVQESGLFKFFCFNVRNRNYLKIKLNWKEIQKKQELIKNTQNKQNKQNGQTIQNKSNGKNTQNACVIHQQLIFDQTTEIPHEKQLKLATTSQLQMILSYDMQQTQTSNKISQILCDAPKQGKTEINCIFKLDINGFITLVSIKDNDGNDINYSIKSYQTLNIRQLQLYKQKQKQMQNRDNEILKIYELKNNLASYIYKQKQHLQQDQIKKYIKTQDLQPVTKQLTQIQYKIQNNQNIQNYLQIQKEIQQSIAFVDNLALKIKNQIVVYKENLQKLKNYISSSITSVQNTFRISQPVEEVLQQLKNILKQVDQALTISKTKNINQISFIPKQTINQQYESVNQLVNKLTSTKFYQESPKHQHFQYSYDPQDYMCRSVGPYARMKNSYFYPQNQGYRQQQKQLLERQRQRQRQQQRYRQKQRERQRQEQQKYQQILQRQAQQQRQNEQKRRQAQTQRFFNYDDPFRVNRSYYRTPNSSFWDGMGRTRGFW